MLPRVPGVFPCTAFAYPAVARPAVARSVVAQLVVACLVSAALWGVPADADDGRATLGAADALWERRAEGHQGTRAAPEPIERAIEAYERLIADQPEDLEIRWKLLRALQFYGEQVLEGREERLVLFERARDLADETRGQLAERIGIEPEERDPQTIARAARDVADAAEIYFYSAVHWGLWGESTGKMKAARQGVAGRLRDYADSVVLIDERFDGAGGLRFLGRLHTEAPKIPFVTGWIDRKQAVADLDRACQLAPEVPANQLFLADALLRFRKDRRSEAIERLEQVVASPPRSSHLVEDLVSISEARALLTQIKTR